MCGRSERGRCAKTAESAGRFRSFYSGTARSRVHRICGTAFEYRYSMPPSSVHLSQQIVWLFVLAIPVACVSWTVTHEEVFREPREYFKRCSKQCRALLVRKFFY